jgi:hypothetical protein
MHSLPPGEEAAPASAAGAQSQLSHVQASHARQHERRWHCSHTCVITVMIAAAEHRAICTALPVGCKFPCYGPQLTLKLAMLWLGHRWQLWQHAAVKTLPRHHLPAVQRMQQQGWLLVAQPTCPPSVFAASSSSCSNSGAAGITCKAPYRVLLLLPLRYSYAANHRQYRSKFNCAGQVILESIQQDNWTGKTLRCTDCVKFCCCQPAARQGPCAGGIHLQLRELCLLLLSLNYCCCCCYLKASSGV